MTFPSDLREAQSYLDRAKAINAKVEAQRQRMIAALNQAVIVIIMFAVAGLWAMSQAEHQLKTRSIENQENVHHG
jgi:excinuclease UvrABC helicase subunit UvrB